MTFFLKNFCYFPPSCCRSSNLCICVFDKHSWKLTRLNVLNKYDEEFGSQGKTLKTNNSIGVHWGLLNIDERAFHQYVGRAEPSTDIFTPKELCTVCIWPSGINFQRESFSVWQNPTKAELRILNNEWKGLPIKLYNNLYHHFWRYSLTLENCPKNGHKRRRTAHSLCLE